MAASTPSCKIADVSDNSQQMCRYVRHEGRSSPDQSHPSAVSLVRFKSLVFVASDATNRRIRGSHKPNC